MPLADSYDNLPTADGTEELYAVKAGVDKNVTVEVITTYVRDGRDPSVDGTKLDGVEALADVTDAANVAAAGAVMESDATTAAMSFVIDEDTLVTNSATKVPTQQSVKAYVDNHNVSDSTGLLTGGILSTGTASTEYSISDGTAQIIDADGTRTAVSWTGEANRTPTNLLTALITFVGVNSSGTIVEQTSAFSNVQNRTIVPLGVAVHVNKTTVDAVNNEQHFVANPMSQLNDLVHAIGFFNVSGNVISANGANLNLDKSIGTIYGTGINYDVDADDPNTKTLAALTAASFQYRFSDGSNGTTGIVFDPANLDDGAGGLTALSTNNKWSITRCYSFVSNNLKLQRGVEEFSSVEQAIAGITSEAFVTEPSIAANGILRGFIVAKKTATDLSDTSVALFISASRFQASTGGIGSVASTLQNVYDNSSTPEILTNATNGALSVKRGSGADTDTLYEGVNAAGSTTFSVAGDGTVVTASTVDGRDVATDGTKLDGIEALADVTDVTNVTAAGALMDSEVDANIKTLVLPASTTISAFGATVIDDANAAAAQTTLGVDPAGTDNSTDVTLAGTGTYISLAGQAITVDPITESDISDLGAYITSVAGDNLSALADVTITANSDGELLRWNGAAWINNTLSEAGIQPLDAVLTATTASFLIADESKLDGIEALADVTDVTNVTAAGALMDSEVDANIKTLVLPASVTIGSYNAYMNTASELAFQQAVNLEIGVDVQAYDAVLGATTASFLTADETKLDGIEASADVSLGKHTIFIPAAAMTPRTTSGAAAGSAEATTNKQMITTLDFDTAADEFAQFVVQMPKGWNASTVTAQFIWSHAATTTNFGVRFFIQAIAFVDGDALDTAFGTAVGHTADTGGTTDDIYITAETAAITIANTPAKSDFVVFQIYRDVSDAGDTLAVDARLHGISLFYTTDAATDA